MRIFTRRSKSVSKRQITQMHVDWLQAKLIGPKSHPDTNTQLLQSFAAMADQFLQQYRVEKIEQLPDDVMVVLEAMHTAVFGDDAELQRVSASFSRSRLEELRQIRHFANDLRAREKADAEAEQARRARARSEKIDLEAELGGREDGEFVQRLVTWLSTQPPDPALWHEIATNTDPDGKQDLYLWIIVQPDCDAATAAHIFHLNNSFEFLRYADQDAADADRRGPRFRIAKEIADRWGAGQYRTFRYTLEKMDYEESLDSYKESAEQARAEFGRAPFEIHPGLFEFREGETPNTRYFYSDFTSFQEAFG